MSLTDAAAKFAAVAAQAATTSRAGSAFEGQLRQTLSHINTLDQTVRDHLTAAIRGLDDMNKHTANIRQMNAETERLTRQASGERMVGPIVPELITLCAQINRTVEQADAQVSAARQKIKNLQVLAQDAKNAYQLAVSISRHTGEIMRMTSAQVEKAQRAQHTLGG